MPKTQLYPLKLKPALHVKVWGGRKLADHLRKPLPTAAPYGESWEVHDSVTVAEGPLRGHTLGELTRRYGPALVGPGNDPDLGFPLLAKLIDAGDWLSVQAHPDDQQAQALEGEPRGKTEAWMILQAEPGAKLVIGLAPGTSRAQLARAIAQNQLEALLVYAAVQPGDVLYMPANTVHALGPGLLIYEVQQSSDTTYRLYDWGRLGLDGAPRELHIDKALAVANLAALPTVERPSGDLLVDGDYFRSWRHTLLGETKHLRTDGMFQCLTCIDGALSITADAGPALELGLGETGLIPACISEFRISGAGTLLRSCQT